MTAGAFWSNEKRELARKLYVDDGLSAQQVAKKIGAQSRSAVIGMMHRLGHTRKPEAAQIAAKINQPKAPARSKAVKNAPVSKAAAVSGPSTALTTSVALSGPTLLQLGSNDCRFPLGDFSGADQRFCGEPAAKSWCDAHQRRVFNR